MPAEEKLYANTTILSIIHNSSFHSLARPALTSRRLVSSCPPRGPTPGPDTAGGPRGTGRASSASSRLHAPLGTWTHRGTHTKHIHTQTNTGHRQARRNKFGSAGEECRGLHPDTHTHTHTHTHAKHTRLF